MKNEPRSDNDRIVIHRGSADAKKRMALESRLSKMEFKSITDAFKYAYDNPDKVDYGIMRDFISKNQRTLVWDDNNLELLKAAKDIFIDNPESTPKDMKFIDGVLSDHIGTIVDNFAREFQTNHNMSQFDICKKYELIIILTNAINTTPDLLPSVHDIGSKKTTGFKYLNALKSMMEESVRGLSQHYSDLLKYRYREDGTRQTFDEQMTNILTSEDNKVDVDYLRKLINHDGTFLQGNDLSVLRDFSKYIDLAKFNGKNDFTNFIQNVYRENLPILLDTYEGRFIAGEITDVEQLLTDFEILATCIENLRRVNPAIEDAAENVHSSDIELAFFNCNTLLIDHNKEKIDRIKNAIAEIPEVRKKINPYKYKEDGSERSLAEMIDFARDNSDKISLPILGRMILESDVAKQDNSLSMLEPLNKFIHIASEDREVNFINGVIKNCLPTCIENYAQTFENKGRERTDNDLIAYKNIVTYLNTSEKNKRVIEEESIVHENQEGTEEPKKTVTERLAEIKAMMDERWPGIEDAANKLDKKRNQRGLFGKTSVYDQLKNMKVSSVGKNKAAEVEARMTEKKHEIEYDGK